MTKKISTPKLCAALNAEIVLGVMRSYDETIVPSRSVAMTFGLVPIMPEVIGLLLRRDEEPSAQLPNYLPVDDSLKSQRSYVELRPGFH